MTINVTRSSMPDFDEYQAEIKDLWQSHWLTNNGSKHRELEQQLLEYLDVPALCLFTNGHLALENVLSALNLGGEVITTPFTFISTSNAIVRNGLSPVFCDINPTDYTIDVNKIEALITEKTSAIVPVHVYGNICDVAAIAEIADKYDLKVIYDAAHAFGVTTNANGIGQYGDASMFSFHATKVFNTIEGGAISCSDKTLRDKLEILKNFGLSADDAPYVGTNGKMNEFQAAMGLCNLRHVDAEIAKRKRVAERYNEQLENVPGIRISKGQPGVKSNYSYYPVLFDHYHKNRDEVFEELKLNGINARKYFYPLISDFSAYSNKHKSEVTPVARYIADRVLTLPMYASLGADEVDRICEIIKQ